MERLTIKGATEPVCARKCEYGSSLDCYDCDKHKELLNRLAAYEDTGLEPEEVKEITSWSYGPFHKKMGDWLKAEHEGRLVVLPCKVGDTVYPINADPNYEAKIIGAGIDNGGVWMEWAQYCENVDDPLELWDEEIFYISDIGKTVFLNREEAEAAMKGGER